MSWLSTISGARFYPDRVKDSEYRIEDIAHALSNLCRFGGHTKQFYSVAQHSVLVATIVRDQGGTLEEQLWALMHDATEAYMVDVPTPVKVRLSGYAELERKVMLTLMTALDLPRIRQLPSIIKEADAMALITEASQLVNTDVTLWSTYKPERLLPTPIVPWSPFDARREFMSCYYEIKAKLSSC